MSYTHSLFSAAPLARPAADLRRLPSFLLAQAGKDRQFIQGAAQELGPAFAEAPARNADTASFSGAFAANHALGAGQTGAVFAADPEQERAYAAMIRAAARGQSSGAAPAGEEALPGAVLAAAGPDQAQASVAGAGFRPAPGETSAMKKSDGTPPTNGDGRERSGTQAGTGAFGPDEGRSAEQTFLGGAAAAPESGGGRNADPFESGAGKAEEDNEASEGNPLQLTEEEEAQVEDMKERDREVRTHEQAHVAAGGGLVRGGASYQTETGPDGKAYAVGGEVQIDTSEAGSPEASMTKARRIKAAALAPAEPSSQDRAVAAQASQMESAARTEKREQTQESAKGENGVAGEASGEASGKASGEVSGETKVGPGLARKAAPMPETEPPKVRSKGSGRLASVAAAYERASGTRPPVPRGFTRDVAV